VIGYATLSYVESYQVQNPSCRKIFDGVTADGESESEAWIFFMRSAREEGNVDNAARNDGDGISMVHRRGLKNLLMVKVRALEILKLQTTRKKRAKDRSTVTATMVLERLWPIPSHVVLARPNQVHRRHPHTMGDNACAWSRHSPWGW
jgi:hypothetical protein